MSAERVTIADFPDHGIASIVGRVRYTKRTVASPMFGRECACFQVSVSHRGAGPTVKPWRTSGGYEFILDDGSGAALVYLGGADITISLDAHCHAGGTSTTPAQRRFIEQHGLVEPTTDNLLFVEGVLEPGDLVAAVGWGRWVMDPRAQAERTGYREMARLLEMHARPEEPLIITDDPAVVGVGGAA